MIDPAELVRDLDQAELGEVPHVGRQLAGHARADVQDLDVLVEVLVDAIDEDGQGGLDGSQPRHEVSVGVGGAALELARGEIQESYEMIDDAVQPVVLDESGEPRADLEPVHRADMLEGGRGDGGEPELRPRQRGSSEEGERLPAEYLVADRLVEQVAGGQTSRPALSLIENPLGLQEQRLPESLGGDDDELVIPVRRQEAVDLRSPVEERFVEILRHADVIGVNGPGSHIPPEQATKGSEDSPFTGRRPAGPR